MSASLKWTISQIGARQHYGVPLGFHHLGHLEALYTDVWCRWGSAILSKGPKKLRSLAGRYQADLPSDRVTSFNLQSTLDHLQARRGQTIDSIFEEYLRFGKVFGEWVTRDLAKKKLNRENHGFFGFNTGCLETLEMLRDQGVLTIVDQIDPARVEEEMIFQESQKWPGWQVHSGRIPEAYFDRLSAEWAAANFVVVNSEWSKNALIAQGVPAKKLLVVPVAYEVSTESLAKKHTKTAHSGPLTVLWIGTVNLRKGIQYLVGAARLLAHSNIRFLVAGPLEISRDAIATAPSNISFLGRITRDQTDEHYRQADVFVLPTISDGFAITQVEAMARGLPVITTRNCGQVVTHGIDGLLVEVGCERALAEAIARLDADRKLLQDMSQQAVLKSRTFHLPQQVVQIENSIKPYRRGMV